MEFYERFSGARMHAAFHKPAFLFDILIVRSVFYEILLFVKNCFSSLEEIHNVLTYNKI
jgi:NADH:ubiquinone oxidoreductase subunit D